jgi:hypothetical protein
MSTMPYTLKVDWNGLTVRDVFTALTAKVAPTSARRAAADMAHWCALGDDAEATIKFEWTPAELTGVQAALAARVVVLDKLILRARDNDPQVPPYDELVRESTRVAVAAREIREYLEAATAAKGR